MNSGATISPLLTNTHFCVILSILSIHGVVIILSSRCEKGVVESSVLFVHLARSKQGASNLPHSSSL